MWWRRYKTAHSLVAIFAIIAYCFVVLATSCKMLEILVDINTTFSKKEKNEQNKIIIIMNKLTYTVLCYCTKKKKNGFKKFPIIVFVHLLWFTFLIFIM